MESTVTYRGWTYQLVTTPKTFINAEIYCQRLGNRGHVTSIHSYYINQMLLRYVRRHARNTASVWLGGLRLLKTRRFIWIDGSRWNFVRWAPGEPNNAWNAEECTEMYISHQSAGYWNDISCSYSKPFICRY